MDDWQFDLGSALVGLAAGLLAALGLSRLRGPAGKLWEKIQDRITRTRRWLTAGVEGRYREELAALVQKRHVGANKAPLEAIFIPTHFIAPPAEPDLESGLALPKPQLPHLWPELTSLVAAAPAPTISLGQVMSSVKRALVIAPPGGGKSTMLAYMTLRSTDDPDSLPLYAHLTEIDLQTEAPEPSEDEDKAAQALLPEEFLFKALQARAGALTSDTLPSILRQAMQENKARILLDGWDDLAPAERPHYAQWLAELLARYPANQFIVSAPLVGYGPLLELNFVPLHIQHWRSAQAQRLQERWAAALDTKIPLIPESDVLGAAKVPSMEFWRSDLNPLDTTLNLWLALAEKKPIIKQAGRYWTGTRKMLRALGETDETKEEEGTNWPLEIGQQVLGQLAQEMAETGNRVSNRARLKELVDDALSQHEEVGGGVGKRCLEALADESGLLAQWGGERLTFMTRALLAYFWAAHQGRTLDPAVIKGRLQAPEWSLPFSFILEMTGSGTLVEQLLAAPADDFQENLFVAADWVARTQGKEQWKRIVLMRLAQLLLAPSTAQALRERAVAALVSTRHDGVGYLLRQAASSPNVSLRLAAVPGLGALATQQPGHSADAKSLETLIKTLLDPSEEVQTAAIHALARTGSVEAEEALIRTLLEGSASIRRVAAETMAQMGKEGHQILQEALTEDEVLIRRAALYGLILVEEPWVRDKLESVMREDAEWFVRSTAEELLDTYVQGPKMANIEAVQPQNLGWLISWAAEQGLGVPAGPAAYKLLQGALQAEDRPDVRAMATRSMGDMGRADVLESIDQASHDPDPQVREAAFFSQARLSRAWHPASTGR